MTESKSVDNVLMRCGHSANAIDANGQPRCVICTAKVTVPSPDLSGRMAECTYCGKRVPSSVNLPFFEYKGPGSLCAETKCHVCGYYTKGIPLKNGKLCYCNTNKPIPSVCINKGKKCVYGPLEYDEYYCGCRGWD